MCHLAWPPRAQTNHYFPVCLDEISTWSYGISKVDCLPSVVPLSNPLRARIDRGRMNLPPFLPASLVELGYLSLSSPILGLGLTPLACSTLRPWTQAGTAHQMSWISIWQMAHYSTPQTPITWAYSSHIGSVSLENLMQSPTTNYCPKCHQCPGHAPYVYTTICSRGCLFHRKTPPSYTHGKFISQALLLYLPKPDSFHLPLGLLLQSERQPLLLAYPTASLEQQHICTENSYLTLERKKELS